MGELKFSGVDVEGTDTILRLVRDGDKVQMIPMSKKETVGSRWINSAVTGTLLFLALVVIAETFFNVSQTGRIVYLSLGVIVCFAVSMFLRNDLIEEKGISEGGLDSDKKFFADPKNLVPVQFDDANIFYYPSRDVIDAYRSAVEKVLKS